MKKLIDTIQDLYFEFKRVNWGIKILTIITLLMIMPVVIIYGIIKTILFGLGSFFKRIIRMIAG